MLTWVAPGTHLYLASGFRLALEDCQGAGLIVDICYIRRATLCIDLQLARIWDYLLHLVHH